MGKTLKYVEGYRDTSSDGYNYEVVHYGGRKKIRIRFSCGKEKVVSSTHINKGEVKYVFASKTYKIGHKLYNKKGQEVTITGIDKSTNNIKVKFSTSGREKVFKKSTISTRDFTDEIITVKVGDVFKTNNYGNVCVIDYKDARHIEVMFEDGSNIVTQHSQLKSGNVGHPFSGIPLGHRFTNNDGCSGTVVRFGSCHDVDVKWDLGGITNHSASCIKRSTAYCPNFKSVTGVGYFGVGKYKPNKSGKNSNYPSRVYESWQRMIRRCYDEKEQQKPSCRAYKGVKVCDNWHNFQNFALWAEDKLDKFVVGWELDKDMFGDGWLYSPETCCLLPREINLFLSDNYSRSSNLPDGVNCIKPSHPNAKEGYISRCFVNGVREYLGYYNTPEEAHTVYEAAKKKEARRLAESFNSVLTKQQYDKLYNFELHHIHRK